MFINVLSQTSQFNDDDDREDEGLEDAQSPDYFDDATEQLEPKDANGSIQGENFLLFALTPANDAELLVR